MENAVLVSNDWTVFTLHSCTTGSICENYSRLYRIIYYRNEACQRPLLCLEACYCPQWGRSSLQGRNRERQYLISDASRAIERGV